MNIETKHTPLPSFRIDVRHDTHNAQYIGDCEHAMIRFRQDMPLAKIKAFVALLNAAPELLAVLEMAEQSFNVEEIDPLVAFVTIEKIRAVINKAKAGGAR